jgi:hypothetical protein
MVSDKRRTKSKDSAVIQWIPDGPELPVEVLESLEDGDLVLFCGAGISVRAGLPTFKKLVQSVYDFFPDTSQEIEDLIESNQYDRAFYALEAHYGKIARRQVHELLKLQPGADRSTHEAVLRLATGKDGKLRLVTTNFDLAFESKDVQFQVDCAPKLPIAKKERWNSLVYLHGRLVSSDPDCENLVLSSADFGLAYLTERWASRFITELFRRFKVLFIGYSADDPVMRYMLDAFAADRAIGESVSTAFALAAAGPDEVDRVAAEWNSKRVQPILYKVDEHGHERLHSTLKHWADRHALGMQGRAAIIGEQAHSPGIRSARQQVCWALGDVTGHASRIFANVEPCPPFEWLEHLDDAGLLSLHEDAFSKEASLLSPLCATSRSPDFRPHRISANLAYWVASHLKDRRLVEWAIERGTYLHASLRAIIRRKLSQQPASNGFPEGLHRFWAIITSEDYASNLYSLDSAFSNTFEIVERLNNGEWNPVLRREVIAALTPFLRLERAWPGISEPKSEQRLSAYTKGAVILRAEQSAVYIYGALVSHKDRSRVLLDLVYEASYLVDRVCDLLISSEDAGDGFDYSYIWRPSIEQHHQNMDHQPWLMLVSLARDSFLKLADADPFSGRILIDHWRASRIPLLRRFVFFAAAKTSLWLDLRAWIC